MPLKQSVQQKLTQSTPPNPTTLESVGTESANKSLLPINQIKNIRYKKFELEQKLSQKKNDADVVDEVNDYHKKLEENRDLVKADLEKQKAEFFRKLQQRKDRSFSSASRIHSLHWLLNLIF